ncbi:hypothetical protein [Sandarakinorhabdus sp. DWP1-3-1]|uniref:hypothetical protein n=1 Tax=Sandarakinorhabdus sp. DWP1-3-1 TaxID=2804627 RepID=UPI003CF8D5F3
MSLEDRDYYQEARRSKLADLNRGKKSSLEPKDARLKGLFGEDKHARSSAARKNGLILVVLVSLCALLIIANYAT